MVPGAGLRTGAAEPADQGRFMLQVVGTMACAVSTLDTRCQPQPVFSSSNGSLVLSDKVKYDVEHSGLGFKTDEKIAAADTAMSTTCKMTRP